VEDQTVAGSGVTGPPPDGTTHTRAPGSKPTMPPGGGAVEVISMTRVDTGSAAAGETASSATPIESATRTASGPLAAHPAPVSIARSQVPTPNPAGTVSATSSGWAAVHQAVTSIASPVEETRRAPMGAEASAVRWATTWVPIREVVNGGST
jgi:hypothetical protein